MNGVTETWAALFEELVGPLSEYGVDVPLALSRVNRALRATYLHYGVPRALSASLRGTVHVAMSPNYPSCLHASLVPEYWKMPVVAFAIARSDFSVAFRSSVIRALYMSARRETVPAPRLEYGDFPHVPARVFRAMRAPLPAAAELFLMCAQPAAAAAPAADEGAQRRRRRRRDVQRRALRSFDATWSLLVTQHGLLDAIMRADEPELLCVRALGLFGLSALALGPNGTVHADSHARAQAHTLLRHAVHHTAPRCAAFLVRALVRCERDLVHALHDIDVDVASVVQLRRSAPAVRVSRAFLFGVWQRSVLGIAASTLSDMRAATVARATALLDFVVPAAQTRIAQGLWDGDDFARRDWTRVRTRYTTVHASIVRTAPTAARRVLVTAMWLRLIRSRIWAVPMNAEVVRHLLVHMVGALAPLRALRPRLAARHRRVDVARAVHLCRVIESCVAYLKEHQFHSAFNASSVAIVIEQLQELHVVWMLFAVGTADVPAVYHRLYTEVHSHIRSMCLQARFYHTVSAVVRPLDVEQMYAGDNNNNDAAAAADADDAAMWTSEEARDAEYALVHRVRRDPWLNDTTLAYSRAETSSQPLWLHTLYVPVVCKYVPAL